MRHSISLAWLALVAATAITTTASCSSSKNATTSPKATVTAPTASKSVGGKLPQRFEAMLADYGTWTDAKIPVNLRLASPASVSIGGTVYMTRGRDIYMSFRFLGMEVLNVYVTTDSLFATYKMGKIYLAEPLKPLLGDFPVTVGNVQDLLLGRAFEVGRDSIDISGATLLAGADKGYVARMPEVDNLGYRFNIAAGNTVSSLVVSTPFGREIACTYGIDLTTPVGLVTPEASVNTKVGKTTIDATLEWNLSKASWNTGTTKTWSAPKGYRRVKPAELLSGFSIM